jgi:hypothetical protein
MPKNFTLVMIIFTNTRGYVMLKRSQVLQAYAQANLTSL